MSMGGRRLEGRDEAILDPDLPIVDAHHHLFDFSSGRYLLDDFLDDARAGHRIVASVYIEIQAFARQDGPELLRPLGEIEFANGVGAMCAAGQYGPRVAAAIVGHADLRHGDAIADYLDQALALAPSRFRGVRQVAIEHPSEAIYRYITHRPPKGVLQAPAFRDGIRQIAARGLVFDAAVFHNQLPEIADLAHAFPDLTIVLNHLGLAVTLDGDDSAEVFRQWRAGLDALARHENVLCKIGGLGLPFWGFGLMERDGPTGSEELAEIWRPYVETAIAAFGAGRCMMESNYPPDSRSCGYVPAWNALKRIVAGAANAEKADLFHRTAARTYRIPLAEA